MPLQQVNKRPMGLRKIALCIGAALLAGAAPAHAVTLQQAYEAALVNDPAYRMNVYEAEAGKETRILGRSGLLPNVSGSYSANKNRVDLTRKEAGKETTTFPRYNSHSAVIQLRQPLFNLEALARYRQSISQSNESAARFEANSAEVILRVFGAYIDVLFATDQLAQVKAQRDAYLEQMKVNKRLFEKGEGTRTDQLETQARLDLVEAQVLEAENNVVATRNALEGVIGMDPGQLQQIDGTLRATPLSPVSFEEWRKLAEANNPELRAARFSVETARQEINKSRAGHAPRIDMVAAYSKNASESINTLDQHTENRSVGVQINIPLYSGGAVNAVTRQAAAGYERAKANLEGKTNTVLLELRKAHSTVVSSMARIDALIKAVDSAKLLMTATEQSVKGGVRINLDLLNAQEQMLESQRDLSQARYTYLLGVLRLKAASGTLTPADLREMTGKFK